jgi:hypothetical protein
MAALTLTLALSWISGQARAATCAYSGWANDGCAAANGSFLIAPFFGASSFYAFAAQSGQKWAKGAHPWNWNSPGVDYAIGPAPGTTFADPAKVRMPAGCTYRPETTAWPHPQVYCGEGAVNPTLTGVDFSLHGCTVFLADGRVSGVITLANSRFKNGPNCSVNKGSLIKIINGSAGLSLNDDVIDEAYGEYKAALASTVIFNSSGGPLTVRNTAILNASARPISSASLGPLDIENSVFIGFALASASNTGEHGEVVELLSRTFQSVYPSIIYRNNVVVIPASSNGVVTSAFYPNGTRAMENVIDTLVADRNVVVVNATGGREGKVAKFISGSVDNNVLTVKPGYSGEISVKSTILGLPGVTPGHGRAATILEKLSDTQYRLSGDTPSGSFTGGRTYRTTTSVALVEMSYAAEYRHVAITDNAVDPTGALFCIQNLGSRIDEPNIRGNRSLVTGTAIEGIGSSKTGATCPPLY